MNPVVGALNRVLALLLGLTLIVGGLLVIGWRFDADLARTVFDHVDRGWYLEAPEQHWWVWALAAGTLLTFVAGLWLLLANVRPNRAGAVLLGGSDDFSTLTVSPAQLGNAVTAMLIRHPAVVDASSRAVVDRGVPVLRILVVAESGEPLDHVRRVARDSVARITESLEGAELATQVFVRYAPVG